MMQQTLARILVVPVLAVATYAIAPLIYRSHADEGFPLAANVQQIEESQMQKTTLDALHATAMFAAQNDYVADGVAMLFSFEDRAVLRLENMFVSNAHHLQVEVELSQPDGTTIWQHIGSLKADTGAFNYDLDSSLNVQSIIAVRIIQPITENVFGIAKFNQ